MGKKSKRLTLLICMVLSCAVFLFSCAPKVACPTGHIDAKALAAGASNGKGTEKKRTENGLIKAKKKSIKKKRRR